MGFILPLVCSPHYGAKCKTQTADREESEGGGGGGKKRINGEHGEENNRKRE